MAEDKRDRRTLLTNLSKQRFEQEVAEEIGISLSNRGGRANRRVRAAAASPGASEALSERRDPTSEPEA